MRDRYIDRWRERQTGRDRQTETERQRQTDRDGQAEKDRDGEMVGGGSSGERKIRSGECGYSAIGSHQFLPVACVLRENLTVSFAK